MSGDPRDESSDRPTSPSSDDSTTPMDAGHWKGQGPRSPATLGVGELLAHRYKVLRYIGKGGMGEVYEAEDCELRERVALKTILPEIAGQEESIQRFKREIQLARKVTHPNVCRIFDLVYHGTTIFLTMELLEGETLAQRLRRTGAMTTGEAFPLVAQMAAALAAAHKAGIVHRDFKCGNVMLVRAKAEDGGLRPVIMDFGLARRSATSDASMGLSTTSGVISGTPAYMAPEQVEGREITPAADIYALGVVIYEMVTGRCPFEGDTPLSTAVKRLQEPAPSPRSHNPSLDPRWERAILRCLERIPTERFSSAEEIIKALEPQAPPVEPSEQPRMLEAAAPKRAAVGRSMQVLAMIRRVESAGLKPFVDIEETAPLTKEDIRAKPFRLEFPLDRKGTPQSAEVILRLDSPDFEPKSQTKKLMVPPERDSEVCTFLLTPKVGGELLLNLEVLKGEVLVASRAIRTVAEITEQPLAIGPNVLVSIPLEVIAYGLRAAAGAPVGEAQWPRAAQAAPPAPPPTPGFKGEYTPMRGMPTSEAGKPLEYVGRLPHSSQTSPRPVAPSAPPPRPMASPPPPTPPMAKPVPPPASNIPPPAIEGTVVFSGLRAAPPPGAAAPPRVEPKITAPAPAPPRAMPAPPVMARKEASRKSPMIMVAGSTLVVILAIGGFMTFRPHPPAGTATNQQVATSNIPEQEKQANAPPPEARTQPNSATPSLQAKAEFDAAAGAQNRGDLQGALKQFQAIAAKPGNYQLEAKARIPKLNEMIDIAGAQQQYNAALQAENSGNLEAALAEFKALAAKPGPKQAEALDRVGQLSQAIADASTKPTIASPAPPYPEPSTPTTSTRNAKVVLLPSGDFQRWNGPVSKGQMLPDNSIEGGLKPIGSLTVPPLSNAPQGAIVVFIINIDPDGNVTPGRKTLDDYGLGPEVMAVARAWKFEPPMVKGKPVSTAIRVKVTFGPSPGPSPGPTHKPVITPLFGGEPQPLTLPWRKGMLVPDYNVDSGLQSTNLTMPPVQGAPAGSMVVIEISIDENGNVNPNRILNDTSGFGSEVQKAARGWKFKPPTAKGNPVKTAIAVRVTF